MSLASAAGVAGAHIIVAAGSYPGFSFSRTDQRFDFHRDAVVTGNVYVNSGQARTRIEGGRFTGAEVTAGSDATDILFANTRLEMGRGVYMCLGANVATRVAFVNSTSEPSSTKPAAPLPPARLPPL